MSPQDRCRQSVAHVPTARHVSSVATESPRSLVIFASAVGWRAGPPSGQVDEPELADLHLITAGQRGDVRAFPVDIGAVQAAHIVDGEPTALAAELGVPAADRDVVEKDVAVGMPPGRGDVLVEQEAAAGVGAALDYQQRRTSGEG